MIGLDEATIDGMAPNADAAKNGRALIAKKKFNKLHISDDDQILFGECQGSGKDPYQCSVDFVRADQPTFRCSCPSRQLPCKHGLGLLYAYAQKKAFTKAAVPADLQAKREKLTARKEKQATAAAEPAKPKQVNTAALAKKVKAQLDGMDVLEKLVHDAVRLGVGNMNAKLARQMEEQAKKLGDAYLPGARMALHGYTQLFADEGGKFADKKPSAAQTERTHTEALDQLARLHAVIKQGRAYLKKRLDDPNLAVPTDTAIAAWLGHAWQLTELKTCGLVEPDANLVQLAFNSHDDPARQELVDTGIWMTLGSGKIRVTQTLRPYKALKFIKAEDSVYGVVNVKELCVYPGSVNPRIRWDASTTRPLEPKDLQTVRGHGRGDFVAAVKDVKNALRAPLADRTPILALNYKTLGRVAGEYVIEDAAGNRLVLTDTGMAEEPASVGMIPLLPKSVFAGQTLVVRFRHDLDTRQLRVKPLSIVTEREIVRLTL
ncbi:MAG TPA: SWIM zinc finger family protein [Urbifossiella sp.]|nr:SWIM zinc finger family protein [Urbifossiella sp.]